MSAAVLTAGTPATSRPAAFGVVRSLALVEVRRLLHQPVFLIGALLFIVVTVTTPFTSYADADYDLALRGAQTNLDWPVTPAFFLGLGGLIAMNRVTNGALRAGDVVEAVPATKLQRSLALCLVCLVPAVLALLGAAYVFTFWLLDPPVQSVGWGEFTTPQLLSLMFQGFLAALGGPLLGVAVARWWRWPTAGAITAVGLVLWSVLGSVFRDTSWWAALVHQSAPFALASYNTENATWTQGGSHHWRVAYLAGLCVLAALAACAHGTTGEQRRRLVRVSVVVGALTLVVLGLAAFTGPQGHYAPWNPLW